MGIRRILKTVRSLSLEDISRARDIVRTVDAVGEHSLAHEDHLVLLYRLAARVTREDIPGDLVECGAYNGASAAVLGRGARDARRLWLFDSFEGLPRGGERDNAATVSMKSGAVRGNERVARQLLMANSLRNYEIRKGWFQDTFPAAKVGSIAILHVDADWYESTKLAIATFWPRVSCGGYLVIDDYVSEKYPGVRAAVDELIDHVTVASKFAFVRKTPAVPKTNP
jgi:O-methyltransferase